MRNKVASNRKMRTGLVVMATGLTSLLAATPSHAIVVTQTNGGAALLSALLSGSGLTNVGITVSGSCSAQDCQTGTFTNASGT